MLLSSCYLYLGFSLSTHRENCQALGAVLAAGSWAPLRDPLGVRPKGDGAGGGGVRGYPHLGGLRGRGEFQGESAAGGCRDLPGSLSRRCKEGLE